MNEVFINSNKNLTMKSVYFIIALLAMFSCTEQPNTTNKKTESNKNDVLVLGTIHSGHHKHEEFNLDVLTDLIKKIDPDVILTEIPQIDSMLL